MSKKVRHLTRQTPARRDAPLHRSSHSEHRREEASWSLWRFLMPLSLIIEGLSAAIPLKADIRLRSCCNILLILFHSLEKLFRSLTILSALIQT